MLTLLAVFKDLIPAYRIRPTDEAPEQVITRAVHRHLVGTCVHQTYECRA